MPDNAMMFVPYAMDAFAILAPFLPRDTRLTSTARTPQDQLNIIRSQALSHGLHVPPHMTVENSRTWVDTLTKLRQIGMKTNAPAPGTAIPLSPHLRNKIVFDLSGSNLEAIKLGCLDAEKRNLLTFTQLLIEPNNNAVHCEVKTISQGALDRLYRARGWATA